MGSQYGRAVGTDKAVLEATLPGAMVARQPVGKIRWHDGLGMGPRSLCSRSGRFGSVTIAVVVPVHPR